MCVSDNLCQHSNPMSPPYCSLSRCISIGIGTVFRGRERERERNVTNLDVVLAFSLPPSNPLILTPFFLRMFFIADLVQPWSPSSSSSLPSWASVDNGFGVITTTTTTTIPLRQPRTSPPQRYQHFIVALDLLWCVRPE